MKTLYKTILCLTLLALVSCQKSVHYTIPGTVSQASIKLSATEITLNKETPTEIALIVNIVKPETEDLTYRYKMDLAKNDFTDPTNIDDIPNCQTYFTHKDLNDFLRERGINGDDNFVNVDFRVYAYNNDTKIYHTPATIKTTFAVKGYYAGPEDNIDQVYMLGDGTPFGWIIENPYKMPRAPGDARIFTYSGLLYPRATEGGNVYCEGRIKFPLRSGSSNWNQPFLMASEDDALARGTKSIIYVPKGSPDYRFVVEKYGVYDVTLNVEEMTCTFECIDDFNDLAVQRVWIVGDATPRGWAADPFPQELSHDTAKRTIFTWESDLTEGEFKFPTAIAHWECPTIMPTQENAPIEDGSCEITTTDNHDWKWRVTAETAGHYIITIDIESMTIKFEKQ